MTRYRIRNTQTGKECYSFFFAKALKLAKMFYGETVIYKGGVMVAAVAY